MICATHGVTKIETVGAMAFYKNHPWMVDFLTGDSFVENGHKLDQLEKKPILTNILKYTHQSFHKFIQTSCMYMHLYVSFDSLCITGFGGDFFGPNIIFPNPFDRGEEYVCGVGVSPTDQDEDHLTGHTGCLSRLLMVAWELKNLPRRFWPGGKLCLSNTELGSWGSCFFCRM